MDNPIWKSHMCLKFAFGIYDLDNDGFISNGELYTILKTMVGNNLKPEQLQQLVVSPILVQKFYLNQLLDLVQVSGS